MLTPGELASWREALRAWRQSGDPEELADAMADLSDEERAEIWAKLDAGQARAEVEDLLLRRAR